MIRSLLQYEQSEKNDVMTLVGPRQTTCLSELQVTTYTQWLYCMFVGDKVRPARQPLPLKQISVISGRTPVNPKDGQRRIR